MLTAIHFHFAGFVLPLLAGWSTAAIPGRRGERTCIGVLLGVPTVAIGITSTHLGGPPLVEAVAACGLSLSGISTAELQAVAAWKSCGSRLGRGPLLASSVTRTATMVLSIFYGLRSFQYCQWLDIPWMRAWHGTGKALGACLLGVTGWWLIRQPNPRPAGE
jgi:hypothetical protein